MPKTYPKWETITRVRGWEQWCLDQREKWKWTWSYGIRSRLNPKGRTVRHSNSCGSQGREESGWSQELLPEHLHQRWCFLVKWGRRQGSVVGWEIGGKLFRGDIRQGPMAPGQKYQVHRVIQACWGLGSDYRCSYKYEVSLGIKLISREVVQGWVSFTGWMNSVKLCSEAYLAFPASTIKQVSAMVDSLTLSPYVQASVVQNPYISPFSQRGKGQVR